MRGNRMERVNELLRSEISELVSRELKDPRLTGLISITEVKTTSDLRHSRVYVSVYGSDEEQKSSLAALRSAAGFLRYEVAQRVTLRHMPELEFELDTSMEHGDRILRLLKQVNDQSAPAPKRRAARAKSTDG